MAAGARISVVIPALNEADAIVAAVSSLPPDPDLEILVADGGSIDGTRDAAARAGAKVVESRRGRGPQMNAGAAAATGDILVFHHADTRLPPEPWRWIRDALADPHVAGGAFLLSIGGDGWFYRFTARNANIRARVAGSPYGDQSFFVRRSAFDAVHGYRDLEYCEDLDFIRRLRRQGRVVLLPAPVVTSARRWEKHGKLRITLRNGALFFRYWLGLLRERR